MKEAQDELAKLSLVASKTDNAVIITDQRRSHRMGQRRLHPYDRLHLGRGGGQKTGADLTGTFDRSGDR